jgi:hypothetical protein
VYLGIALKSYRTIFLQVLVPLLLLEAVQMEEALRKGRD